MLLHNKLFAIASKPKYDKFQRGVVPMLANISMKRSVGAASGAIKIEAMPNHQSAVKSHKPNQKTESNTFFTDNIWGTDHEYMQSLNRYNKGTSFFVVFFFFFFLVNMHE